MKKKAIALALLTAMTLAACGSNGQISYKGSGSSIELTKKTSKLKAPGSEISDVQISALSVAGTKLFAQTVAEEGEDSNVLISPVSVALAFGIAEGGAKNNTLSQIEDVIGGGNTIDEMSPLLYDLSTRMKNAPEVDWNAANSIWFKDDGTWEILPEFTSKAASWYDAQLWQAPFDASTLQDINGWVNAETRGMIPEIIKKIDANARMYIINALAFEAEWMVEYEGGQIREDRDFTNADGTTAKVTMLYSDESRYFQLNGGNGFLRQYKGGQYSFMGLLPERGTDLNDYIKSLADSNADISEAIRNCTSNKVVVAIPEFTDDYDVELTNPLIKLGMTDAFSESNADFSDMMRPLNGSVYHIWISSVIHKTHIEVDRNGTKAAAATAIVMLTDGAADTSSRLISIILDRPFIYGIIDNETGLPIFLGCVNQL